MTYEAPNTNPAAMTTEELTAELADFVPVAAGMAARMSLVLAELKKRRQPHALFSHPILRFFQSIAENKLNPEAAIILGNSELIKRILPLPKDQQLSIAGGAPVPIAVRALDGQIKSDDVPIRRMDPETLRRAFGPGGIRPVSTQADMIRAEGRIERHGMITVLRNEMMLKIGNQKVTPEELEGPLRALGYDLRLAREKADAS